MSVLAEYYQRHHAGEGGFRRYGFTIRGDERFRWFAQRVGTGNRLLDLGCRDGTMTGSFVSGNEVTGIDIDESALEVAHARLGIRTRVVNLNAEVLPFEDGSFDAVVAGEILEHLQFPDFVIGEVWRVLRPGGVFCGSVPNAFRLWNRLLFLAGRDFEQDPTHLHHFSPTSLKRMLDRFSSQDVAYLASRHLWLSPRLMGTMIAWSCRK